MNQSCERLHDFTLDISTNVNLWAKMLSVLPSQWSNLGIQIRLSVDDRLGGHKEILRLCWRVLYSTRGSRASIWRLHSLHVSITSTANRFDTKASGSILLLPMAKTRKLSEKVMPGGTSDQVVLRRAKNFGHILWPLKHKRFVRKAEHFASSQ